MSVEDPIYNSITLTPEAVSTVVPQQPIIEIYEPEQFEQITWPAHQQAQALKAMLQAYSAKGSQHYIANIKTQLAVLHVDQHWLPISINNDEYTNSWVCSPYGQFIGFGQEVVADMKKLPKLVKAAIQGILLLFKLGFHLAKMNKVVTVNNWLFPTPLWPALDPEQLSAITKQLQQRYPKHVILIRGLGTHDNTNNLPILKALHYTALVSRLVYVTDCRQAEPFKARMFKSDLKVLQQTDYEIISHEQITESDAERLVVLYRKLYIEKYSQLSPQFTAEFVKLALKQRLLEFIALRKNGQIDAAVGFIRNNGVVNSPFFAYDTDLAPEIGLYRMISTLITLYAKDHALILNNSSGAGSFKRLRRAEQAVEYMAVNALHLSFYRRWPWFAMSKVLNSVGLAFMKRFDL